MSRRCEIDAELLFEAFTRPPDWEAYLDPDSGEVVLGATFEDEDEEESERLLWIPRLEGRREYELMADFAASVDEADVREQFTIALDGRGAFGRFRQLVQRYPDLNDRWQRLRREWLLGEAREWLAGLEVDAVLQLPSRREPSPPRPERRVSRIGLLDLLLLGAPEGKTELLDGTVWRVFRAATAGEARAVFKNVARDLCEFHGIAWRNRFVEGRDSYAIERYQLRVEGEAVELAVQVSPELWRRFG